MKTPQIKALPGMSPLGIKPKANLDHPDPALAGERAARRDAAEQAAPFSQEKKNLKAQVLNALRLSQNRMQELADAPLTQEETTNVAALSNELDDLIMVFCEQLIGGGK